MVDRPPSESSAVYLVCRNRMPSWMPAAHVHGAVLPPVSARQMRQTAASDDSLESGDARGDLIAESRQTIPGREIALCKRSEIVKNADSQPDIASGTPGTIQARNLYATTRNGGASDSVNASISSKVDLGSVRINGRPASVAYVNQRRHVFAPCSLQVTQVTS